jgi:hypothetical protein
MGEAAKFREDRGEVAKDERRRQLLSDFAEQWASINKGRFEPSTRIRYVNCLAHASAALGHIYVDALEPSDFRKWVADKLGEGYSSATVASWLRVVRLVLDDAVSDGLLPGNQGTDTGKNTGEERKLPHSRGVPTVSGARPNVWTRARYRTDASGCSMDWVPEGGAVGATVRRLQGWRAENREVGLAASRQGYKDR